MARTQAYTEIIDQRCPLSENYRAVRNLLDYLMNQKALTKKQRDSLTPKIDKLELGHYHGLPKPHKVVIFFMDQALFSLHLAWHATTTHHCLYPCTNNIGFEIFKRSFGTDLFTSGSSNNIYQ